MSRAERLSHALLLLAGVSSLAAFAGPRWGHRIDRLAVIVAVDRSRSMERLPDAEARVARFEREAAGGMRDGDRLGRVVYGAGAATGQALHERAIPPSSTEVPIDRDGTDLAAAIDRSLSERPDDAPARIVLLGDGASNRGDALAAAARAVAAGVPIDVLPMSATARRELRVSSVRAPSRLDEREAFELRVVTFATERCEAEVRVSLDGAIAHRGRVTVEAGEGMLSLPQTAPGPGMHRYEVEVIPRDPTLDRVPEDNLGGSFVRVRGPASVLVLEGDPGASAPLSEALRQGGFRVVEGGTWGFPADLAALSSYDLLVLSDVPARALSTEQLEWIRTYVRDLGGGLWLMGGDRSLGPGGYARTPVEEVSPVSFDLRQERRRASLAEVISIDYSGSMTAVVGGYTKIRLANEAAARSALLLGQGDQLGVAHVDTSTTWTMPLGPVDNLEPVLRRIRAVGAGGGGIIVPTALADAYRALRAARTDLRHLLLFADGDDAEEMTGCALTVATAFRDGITTSVVSLGRGADTPELERLSREGHGRFYLVEDALRLPTVFAQETILATRAAIREEPFRALPSLPDAVTAGLDLASAPPLGGYVVTLPKPRGAVLLRAIDGDPLLASWSAGAGHAAVFTSDGKDRWGAGWLRWPGRARLWSSLARSLARQDDGRVRAEADATGAVLQVRATAVDADGRGDALRRLTARVALPDGSTRELPLDPAGAGTYAADLPITVRGAYAVAVRDEASGALVASTGALRTAAEEFRATDDPGLLARIASMTGGRVLRSGAEVFSARAAPRYGWTPLAPWLLRLGLLLGVASVLLRRLGLPGRWESGARASASGRPATPLRGAARVERTRGAPTPSGPRATSAVEALRARRREPAAATKRREREPAAPRRAVVPGDGASTLSALKAARRRR
ncbi:MAG: VWA domain-containing protein [Myxococcaceae bacterium]|nr:MAG: VWA domain-containing protein [Myxococcaceae bacterium]